MLKFVKKTGIALYSTFFKMVDCQLGISQDVSSMFKEKTSSGSMVINDAIVHLSVDTLPFGGVGPRHIQ